MKDGCTCLFNRDNLADYTPCPVHDEPPIVVTGCLDMEQYATAYNEGYSDALKHAESLVRALRPGNNSQMRWQSGRDAAARQINAMRKFGTTPTPPGGQS